MLASFCVLFYFQKESHFYLEANNEISPDVCVPLQTVYDSCFESCQEKMMEIL